MQKNHDKAARSGAPLLACLLFGVLFFGAYLVLEQYALKSLPPLPTALLFLGGYLLTALGAYVVHCLKLRKHRGEQRMTTALDAGIHELFKTSVNLPYLICDDNGKVLVLNNALRVLLGVEGSFFRGNLSELCGVTLQEILSETAAKKNSNGVARLTKEAITASEEQAVGTMAERELTVTLADGRQYIPQSYGIMLNGKSCHLISFTDTTELLALKQKIERDMPAIAYIDVDNLEELTQYTHVNYRDASRRVDDILVGFAAELNGYLREYERDRYLLLFSQEKLEACEQDKFSGLLDRVRGIRLGEYSIPVTVSVGVSASDCSMSERAAEASLALEMALQRGGDQVAVRRKEGFRYFGGQTRPFQRRTKVQSRVVASFLLSKISEAENLLVMGHKNPDFDSIGSSLGVAQLGLFAGVPTKIVMDLSNQNFRVATERLKASQLYNDMFISGEKGLDLVRPGTLLIITDANNFRIIESEEIAKNVKQISGKIAIIDHHRQTGEYDFEPVINYIDPSASSASELVSEMLEQSESGIDTASRKLLTDEVASILFSGIMLDTASFTRNTGARTLDAARYLFGRGANAEHVHGFFNENYADYERERSFSGNLLLQDGIVGLTWSHGTGNPTEDRVAAAKEAERLLNIKGVSASFALVRSEEAVHISGRSDGSINVQLILEHLGGGGRFDSAGAAMRGVTVEEAVGKLKEAVAQYFSDLDTHI